MSIRDIKLLSKLIDERISIGLDLDVSLCHEFQKIHKIKIISFLMVLIGFMNYLILKAK